MLQNSSSRFGFKIFKSIRLFLISSFNKSTPFNFSVDIRFLKMLNFLNTPSTILKLIFGVLKRYKEKRKAKEQSEKSKEHSIEHRGKRKRFFCFLFFSISSSSFRDYRPYKISQLFLIVELMFPQTWHLVYNSTIEFSVIFQFVTEIE